MTSKRKKRFRDALKKILQALLVKGLGNELGATLFQQLQGTGFSATLACLLIASGVASIYWLPSLYQKAVEIYELFPRDVSVRFVTAPESQSTTIPLAVRVQVLNKSTSAPLPIAPNQLGIFEEPDQELYFDQTALHLDSEEFRATSLEPSEYRIFAKFSGSAKFKPARSATVPFVVYEEPRLDDIQNTSRWTKSFHSNLDSSTRERWFSVHAKEGQALSQVLQITPQQDTVIQETPFIWYSHPIRFPCEIVFTMRPLSAGAQLDISLNDQLIFSIDTESQFRLSLWERDLYSTSIVKKVPLTQDGHEEQFIPLPIDIRTAEQRYTRVELRLSKLSANKYRLTLTMLGISPGSTATVQADFAVSSSLQNKGIIGFGSSRLSRGIEVGDLHMYAIRDQISVNQETH